METIIDKITYVPKNCLLELCHKCNLNCAHCGSSLNVKEKVRHGRELTMEEKIAVINEVKTLGGEKLGLVGGEPLMCDHWEEIAKYAKSLDFDLSMISNGMLIDDFMAQRIKDSGISLVALSLDGDESFHNKLRRNNKSFKQVLKAAKSLIDIGVQVNFITTIMNGNINILETIEDIISKTGGSFWQLQIGVPMGTLKDNKELVIEPEQLLLVSDFILKAKKRNKVEFTISDTIGYCSQNELLFRNNSSTSGDRVFMGCMAGCLAVAIEANGNVKGCLSLQEDCFIEGNILEDSLTNIWNNKVGFAYNRKFDVSKLNGDCNGCKYGAICRGGCTTVAYHTSGEVNNNPYCLYRLENLNEVECCG